MDIMILYIIICAFFIYFVIKITTYNRTECVECAFAGEFNEKRYVSIPKDRNRTIYTEGDNIIDLTGYNRFIISGHSLEKEGFADGDYIYTKKLGDEPINSIFNHFVVLEIDEKRINEERIERQKYEEKRIKAFSDYIIYKEQPECKIPQGAYIIRKAITKLPTSLDPDIVRNRFLKDVLEIYYDNNEQVDIDDICFKFKFASDYYKDDEYLIVAMTYKDGNQKDYSFHSENFLRAVVKYKSVD